MLQNCMLIQAYEGEYVFIEQDAYKVLFDALLDDQENETHHEQNQVQAVDDETAKVVIKSDFEILITTQLCMLSYIHSMDHKIITEDYEMGYIILG